MTSGTTTRWLCLCACMGASAAFGCGGPPKMTVFRGQVKDARTGKGIEGALVYTRSPQEWRKGWGATKQHAAVSMCLSDRNGDFSCVAFAKRKFEIIAIRDGYQPLLTRPTRAARQTVLRLTPPEADLPCGRGMVGFRGGKFGTHFSWGGVPLSRWYEPDGGTGYHRRLEKYVGFRMSTGELTEDLGKADFYLVSRGDNFHFVALGKGGFAFARPDELTLGSMLEAPEQGYKYRSRLRIHPSGHRGNGWPVMDIDPYRGTQPKPDKPASRMPLSANPIAYVRSRDGQHYGKLAECSRTWPMFGSCWDELPGREPGAGMPFVWMYQPDGSRNLNGRVPKLWRDAGLKSTADGSLCALVVGLKEIRKASNVAEREKKLRKEALQLHQLGFHDGPGFRIRTNPPLLTWIWMLTARDWEANTRAGHNSWRKGATEEFLKDFDARDKRLCDAARPENRPTGVYGFSARHETRKFEPAFSPPSVNDLKLLRELARAGPAEKMSPARLRAAVGSLGGPSECAYKLYLRLRHRLSPREQETIARLAAACEESGQYVLGQLLLRKNVETATRIFAATTIADQGNVDHDRVHVLSDAMEHPDPRVRAAVVRAIG